jgi:CheY-like chemotaxis protein
MVSQRDNDIDSHEDRANAARGDCLILLIEDNPMDVDLTRRAFTRRKISRSIFVARDGEEALSYLERWEAGEPAPMIVLLDLKLPKVDGLEVLHRYKSHPQFRTIPVVILTTSAEESDIQAAYQEGANSYIVKPVDFDNFLQVVEQIQAYWCALNIVPR